MQALVIQRTVPDLVFKLVSTLRQSTMASLSHDSQQQRIILRKENIKLVFDYVNHFSQWLQERQSSMR